MAPQSQINNEVFKRINNLESDVSETKGYLRAIVGQNEKLIRLLTRALYVLTFISTVLLFALVYGAIGKEGLHSVRSAVPTRIAAIPAPGDLDKWMNARRALT